MQTIRKFGLIAVLALVAHGQSVSPPSGGGGAPSGAAGGDLSGTYPNPTVAKINGTAFAGTQNDIVIFGAANIPADSGVLYTSLAPKASPTFTGTVTFPTPFTLGAISVTSTGTQLNYLNAATGTSGNTALNLLFTNAALGTPASGVATNLTGTAAGLTAGSVTTNANLTGPITSVGNATSIAAQTGTGTTFAMSVGPTFTGTPAAPTPAATDNSTTLATTAYVTTGIANAISAAAGRDLVVAATAAVLPNTPTYSNGVSGIGATLTSSTNSVLVVDGYTPVILDRILVKNQASSLQNGIYYVSQLGVAAVTPWILTRAVDYDVPSDINNTIVPVGNNGTTNPLTSWIQTATVATVGTDSITFAAFTPTGANIVTAVSPGVGLCHFAGSTQACTSSTVATADIAAAAVTAVKMVNSGVFTGDATSTFPALTIGNAAITAAKMVNAGVFTGDATSTFPAITISNAAITAAKMVNAGVFTGDATSTFPAITIANNAITAVKMVNAGVFTGDVTTTFPAVTVAKVNGISYSATAAAHSVEVITTANTTATAKVMPDCTDTGGNHINFTQSTDAFSCGTSGGSSSVNALFFPFGNGTNPNAFGACSNAATGDCMAPSLGVANYGMSLAFFASAPIVSDHVQFNVATASGTACTGSVCGFGLAIMNAAGTTVECLMTVVTSGGSPNLNTAGWKQQTWTSGSQVSGGVCTTSVGIHLLSISSDSAALYIATAAEKALADPLAQVTARYASYKSAYSTGNGASLAMPTDISGFSWTGTVTGVSNSLPMIVFYK